MRSLGTTMKGTAATDEFIAGQSLTIFINVILHADKNRFGISILY